ncbi:LCP family protein [Kocuria rhizophila]|uniref:LCP family protein n=1 Tax=Kocuria TaxID=57493 RepID=UPI00064D794C|nr:MULTISPECIES: LCP family protein [Kocuria]KMK74003.1 LytR family regulatory protein [Kocuria rhizophila]KUP27749.1 transcriptional regulator [Kocuria rhizophila]MCR4524898.1 LCP family protein [Kocuria rhizophila]MCT1916259.1 LCP family protein [Kocuria rhizophila]MCT1957216.1 LCP family protein [Kocuria rhizophila]
MSTHPVEFDDDQPTPRKKHTGRNILLVLLGIVLVIGVVAGFFVWNLARNFDNGAQNLESAFPEESSRPAKGSSEDAGTTVLLLGSDKRPEGQDPTVTGSRADSIMLLHIPEDGGEMYVMSIMRDTWVDIPGHGEAKINSALDVGGMPTMVSTIEQNFDTRVDEVALVDFAGFEGLTDALGGVTVDVPVSFTTQDGHQFQKGPQEMNGEEALAFVRERYAFPDGDYQRVRNQRAYLEGLINELVSAGTLTNPMKLNEVVKQISPYLTVSDGLTAGWIAQQAPKMVGMSSSDIHMFTVPNQGLGTSADGQSIIIADEAAMKEIGKAISGGTLDQYAKSVGQSGQ